VEACSLLQNHHSVVYDTPRSRLSLWYTQTCSGFVTRPHTTEACGTFTLRLLHLSPPLHCTLDARCSATFETRSHTSGTIPLQMLLQYKYTVAIVGGFWAVWLYVRYSTCTCNCKPSCYMETFVSSSRQQGRGNEHHYHHRVTVVSLLSNVTVYIGRVHEDDIRT